MAYLSYEPWVLQSLRYSTIPCEGGVPPLSVAQVEKLLPRVPGWTVNDSGTQIFKVWECKNFRDAMALVNKVADLAESISSSLFARNTSMRC